MSRLLLVALLSLSALGFTTAQSAEGLVISTPYPSQEVRAGEAVSITLDLSLTNLSAQTFDLSVSGLPQGWQAKFQGGGRNIHSVFVEPDVKRTVSLNLEVPGDAAEGTQRITVAANGESAQGNLTLELIVSASAPPQLTLEPELPVLKGTPNTTFSYRIKVKNESEEDVLASLDFEAPAGLEVTFKKAFGGQELSSLPIKANQTESVDVSVKPQSQIAAGEYSIRIRAQTSVAAAEVDLIAQISGQPTLNLSTGDGRLSARATAGEETSIELVVRNDGTAPAVNVALTASSPASWEVTFSPDVVASILPGEEAKVTAHINAPSKAVAGDYSLTMRATPAGGSAKSAEFRITVVTSTLWGVVGLVLIAAALGVVALAVSRFGRR